MKRLVLGLLTLARLSRRPPSLTPVAALFALLVLVAPRSAHADPQITARASANEVEVGEPFTVEIKALVEQGAAMPSDPQLRPPPEISVVAGPSISTQMMTQLGGGVASVQLGIGASFQLVATKPGKYVIPSPTIAWSGKRLGAGPIRIEAVPASGRPRRPSSPFLLPGGPLGFPFGGGGGKLLDDFFGNDDEEPEADEDPALAMSSAPDPIVFLRAIPDKTSAVVGEQVALSFYLYERESVEPSVLRVAPTADFVRYGLIDDPRSVRPAFARVGGRRYAALLVDKLALFPLKAGELHTGTMQVRVAGRRIGSRSVRESNDVIIRTTEPPVAGRPPGYVLGNVGRFSLTAAVQPRQIDQGGSLAVTVKVVGTGNFPQSMRVPERTGVDWLDPEKRESLEPRGDAIGGFRSFGYVVRVDQSGTVALGTIELPYWDPQEKRYAVERAELGTVQVNPVAPTATSIPAPAASGDTGDHGDPFAAMPGLRTTLGAYTPPAAPPIEGAPFWCLLAAPPLLVTLFGAGDRVARRMRERRAAGAASPARLAAIAQREADEAAAKGDLQAASAAVERAVHRAIEAATGVRSRGVLLDDLPGELEQNGVPAALATRVCETLAACETIRFEPTSTGEGGSTAAGLVESARAVIAELSRGKPT